MSMARLRKSRKFIGAAGSHAGALRAASGAAADFFSLEPRQLFADAAPLEVELGSGKGDFILERARQFPQRNFLALELAGSVFQWLAIRVARSGLGNLRAIRADARSAVNLMLPAASVRVFHIYFPDPWPKSRHSKHRLLSPSLTQGLARCLEPGGRIYLATDVDWYYEHAAAVLCQGGFRLSEERVPGAERTNFGRRFAAEGKAIHAGCFELRGEPGALRYRAAQADV
jgi:tRNA (guanine-N7-)-methyltransferase